MRRSVLPLALLLLVLGVTAGVAVADGGEWEGGELAEELGEYAWSLGLALNLAFVGVWWSRRYLAFPPWFLRAVLGTHMYGNIAVSVPAFYHGYALLGRAGILEYAVGAVMLVLLVSGVVLRYARHRGVRRALNLVHSQRILSLVLLVLLLLHTAVAED